MEFGAHQVILVRTLESIDRLPDDIKNSNAIFLTVPQAKGLEFDDGKSFAPWQKAGGLLSLDNFSPNSPGSF